jgi:23S rRNA (guanosine2251-2'-O)-methyltransferase
MTRERHPPPRDGKPHDAPRKPPHSAPHKERAPSRQESEPRAPRRAPQDRGFRTPSAELVVLYGAHAVREALSARRRKLLTLYATETSAPRIEEAARAADVPLRIVDARELTRRLGEEAVHQGLLLEARALPEADISDIENKSGIVLVLDQITDPHNVGAILRTAAAFAVAAIVTTARHSPEATGVLAKSASGALESVPIVTVQNLARALTEMKEQGFLVVGLDSEAPDDLSAIELASPLALVLGAEGKGLRQGTRATCDRLARLDLPGAIKSLNVSNAAALSLYIASRAVAP